MTRSWLGKAGKESVSECECECESENKNKTMLPL